MNFYLLGNVKETFQIPLSTTQSSETTTASGILKVYILIGEKP